MIITSKQPNYIQIGDEPEEAWALTDRALTEERFITVWIPFSARASFAPMALEAEQWRWRWSGEKRIPLVVVADLLWRLLEKVRRWNANAAFALTVYVDDCIFLLFLSFIERERLVSKWENVALNLTELERGVRNDEHATSRNKQIDDERERKHYFDRDCLTETEFSNDLKTEQQRPSERETISSKIFTREASETPRSDGERERGLWEELLSEILMQRKNLLHRQLIVVILYFLDFFVQ